MERLRKGYKQTELGVIPEDWGVTKLKELGKVFSGGTPHTGNHLYWDNGEINWCTPTDITALVGKRHIEETSIKITELGLNNSSAQLLPPNSLLVCTRATIGKAAIAKTHFSTNQGFKNIVITKDFNVDYIYYQIVLGEKRMQLLGTGSTFFEVSKSQFDNFQIPIPHDMLEQSAIAEVLNDMDSLIEVLDKKTAKKRAIKEGAMQQLLTGKKRLKGFTKPWVEKNFEEILGKQIRKGQILTASDYVGGVIPVIAGGKTPAGYHAYYNRDRNTITISASGANAGFIAFYRDPIFATDCSTINESTKYDIKFIFFLLCLYQDVIYKAQTGGAQPHIHAKDIYPLEVLYTTNTKEQQAIAQILTDMDDEIRQLENERQKYTALKQGAMQQLLTGQIRLMAESKAQVQVAEQPQKQANIHFKRSVWAAEIVDRLCGEPTFGHVKMEKLIFLTEHMCGIDLGSNYHRDAAGPYDNRAIRSIDSQLKKQNWFEAVRKDKGYRYIPMGKRGGHKDYFDRYYHKEQAVFDKVVNTCRSWNTERCEIVATLYSAWKDLGSVQKQFTDDDIINEVINNWNESKRRIPEERWRKALGWMRENGFAPISI